MILFSRLFFAILVAVLSLPSYAVFASPQSEDIPERPKTEMILPETTVALVQVPNFRDALEKLKESSMGRMAADEAIAPLIDGLWEELETVYGEVQEDVGLELSDLTSLPDGEITFAVIAPRRQNPEYLIIMDLNQEEGVLDRVMERGRKILDSPNYDLSDEDDTGGDDEVAANEDGFEIDSFRVDGKKVHFFRHESTLVACTSLSELNDLIERWMGREVEKTRPLSANRKYVTIMKRCEGTDALDPEFRFFVDPIRVAKSSTLGNPSARTVVSVLRLLGFDSLAAIGGTMFLDVEEYESVMHGHVLLTNPRNGIFGLLAFKPTEYAPEEFVPKAVVNHITISVDAPKAYAELTKIVNSILDGSFLEDENFDRTVEETPFLADEYFERTVEETVNEELGISLKEDIIDSIDGRMTWFQWIEEPAVIGTCSAIAFRLNDTEKFKTLFEEMVDEANGNLSPKKAKKNVQPSIESRNYRDVTIYAAPRSKIEARNERKDEKQEQTETRFETPQVAIFGDCLVISLNSDKLMKTMIDTHLGEGDKLVDDENYSRIVDESQLLLGNELPMANFYVDLKRQLKWMMEVINTEQTEKVMDSAAEGNKFIAGFKRRLDENPLPDFDQLEQYFSQIGGYMSDDDTGLHMLFFTLKSGEE